MLEHVCRQDGFAGRVDRGSEGDADHQPAATKEKRFAPSAQPACRRGPVAPEHVDKTDRRKENGHEWVGEPHQFDTMRSGALVSFVSGQHHTVARIQARAIPATKSPASLSQKSRTNACS